MTQKWLVSSAAMNFAPFFLYWGTILRHLFDNFEDTIRNGQPSLNFYEWIEDQPETSRYFQEAMIAIANYTADAIAKSLKLAPDSKRLLDVGGGHGTYSIALCRKNPDL